MSFKYGDMICYKPAAHVHDQAIMYIGECHHAGRLPGLIDMIGIPEGVFDHKDPSMWQRCTHLDGGASIWIDGKEVSNDVVFAGIDIAAGSSTTVLGIRDVSGTFTITDVKFAKP